MSNAIKSPRDKLVFLTYLNRSGSTYLASKLAAYDEIGVGIEARFQDGWILPGFSAQNSQDLENYLDTLYQDKKFLSWGVAREELREALRAYSFPLKFSEILTESLSLYSGLISENVLLHKCGEYYRCVAKIRDELPGAKFIFIDRDPRAIYSSQKRSLDSQTELPMEENIHHFIFGYLDTLSIIDSLQNDPNFILIRYEDLVEKEVAVLAKVTGFLGVSAKKRTEDGSYFIAVPESQQHLHNHVKSGVPQKKRITGWQIELPVSDILLLQSVLKRHLISQGFSFYSPPQIGFSDWCQFYSKFFLFHYEAIKRRMFNIAHCY